MGCRFCARTTGRGALKETSPSEASATGGAPIRFRAELLLYDFGNHGRRNGPTNPLGWEISQLELRGPLRLRTDVGNRNRGRGGALRGLSPAVVKPGGVRPGVDSFSYPSTSGLWVSGRRYRCRWKSQKVPSTRGDEDRSALWPLIEVGRVHHSLVLLALPVLSALRVRDIPTGVHTCACTDRPHEDA